MLRAPRRPSRPGLRRRRRGARRRGEAATIAGRRGEGGKAAPRRQRGDPLSLRSRGAEGLTDRALVLTETAPRRPPPLPPSWRDAISVPNARWRETFADPPPLVNTQKAEGAAPPSSGCGRGEGDRGAALLQPGG